MSKNKYILPMNNTWYIEYGGQKKEHSHSYDVIAQRYAFDFEIRKNNLPYKDDYKILNNYFCYLEEMICPCNGVIIDIENKIENTKIYKDRPIVNDGNNNYGNYIIIKHKYNEYSYLCHFEKNTITKKIGDQVLQGEVLGLVGNSGNTQGPHIHYHVQKGYYDNGVGVPIKFKNVYSQNKKIKYVNQGMYVQNGKLKD